MTGPNVLVTGGSGFLGQHLIRELRAAGANVRGLSRSAAGDQTLRELGAEPVRGDLEDPAGLDRALDSRPSALFHAAADTNVWSANNARQTRINVDGTRALVAAALAHGVGAFLHTSSVSSFSHLVHGTLTEDTPRRGAESWINYERNKFHAEQAVRAAERNGLRTVVFYPAHIFGPGDTRNWARLIQLIDRGKLPGAPPGSGAFADVREIARAQVRAWQRERWGESYLLGGEHATFLDLIHRVGGQLGRKVPKRATPAWVLRAYARVLEAVSRVTRKPPEISPEAATFTCKDLKVDSSKAQRELDYVLTPLDALLADTIAWMRGAGMLRAA
jgi:dihydroflavonol-4-reductase